MKTQYDRIGALLMRKRGATAMEIIMAAGSVAPHKRLSEMKSMGWIITRQQIAGRKHGRYFGRRPEPCYFNEQGTADRGARNGR